MADAAGASNGLWGRGPQLFTLDGVPAPALNYRCDKLAATGFALTSQVDREIDDTLQLCLRAFRK